MTERLEDLRQLWRERFSRLADPLLEPFQLTEKQRLLEKVRQLEDDLREARWSQGPPTGKRRDSLWAYRIRMRGRMGG